MIVMYHTATLAIATAIIIAAPVETGSVSKKYFVLII